MNAILFYLVIFLTNIIQGITGFAGTILAMPPCIMLMGFDTAKPILNFLGLLAGIYVLATNYKHVDFKEFIKVIKVMACGIIGGLLLKTLFIGHEMLLYKLLGLFVISLAIKGLYDMKYGKDDIEVKHDKTEKRKSFALLLGAGIAHGMFISGGPLLISYLSKTIKDKAKFRATISSIWIVLNPIIFIDELRMGHWNEELVKIQIISIPFLLLGLFAGSKLYKIMSQKLFMNLTYILLFISGITLIVK